jgi:adenylate cyclase
LDGAILVRYTVLEGKFAGEPVFTGRLVKLSTRAAELHTGHPIDVLSNLKLQLLHDNGDVVCGELFAKVLAAPTERAPVVLRFTSVAEEIKTFLAQRQSLA